MEKRTPRDLNMFEAMMFAMELSEIQAEYSQKVVDIAVEYDVDAFEAYKMSIKTFNASVEDPEFIEKVLPILLENAKEANEDEE